MWPYAIISSLLARVRHCDYVKVQEAMYTDSAMSTRYAHVERGSFITAYASVYDRGLGGDYTERRYADSVWKLMVDDMRLIKDHLKAMAKPFAHVNLSCDAAGNEIIVFEAVHDYEHGELGHEQAFLFERCVVTGSPTHVKCSEVGKGAYGSLVFSFLMRACEHTGNDERILSVQTGEGKFPWMQAEIVQMYRMIRWPVRLETFQVHASKHHESFFARVPRHQYVRHVSSFHEAQLQRETELVKKALVDSTVRLQSLASQSWSCRMQAVAGRENMVAFANALRELNTTRTEEARQCAHQEYDKLTRSIDELVSSLAVLERSASEALQCVSTHHTAFHSTSSQSENLLPTSSTPVSSWSASSSLPASLAPSAPLMAKVVYKTPTMRK